MKGWLRAAAVALTLVTIQVLVQAHAGPPFPILSDQRAGPYVVSIWTDPDTTDDGSAGGQFWVRLSAAGEARELPAGTRVTIAIAPADRSGPEQRSAAAPVHGDAANHFAALPMDHEGSFTVHVTIDGALGAAAVDAAVDATYDLRPARWLVLLYLTPFLLVGLLWGRLLMRRRRPAAPDPARHRS